MTLPLVCITCKKGLLRCPGNPPMTKKGTGAKRGSCSQGEALCSPQSGGARGGGKATPSSNLAHSSTVLTSHNSRLTAPPTRSALLAAAEGRDKWPRGRNPCLLARRPAGPREVAHPCLPWKARVCSEGPLQRETTCCYSLCEGTEADRPPSVIRDKQSALPLGTVLNLLPARKPRLLPSPPLTGHPGPTSGCEPTDLLPSSCLSRTGAHV